MPADLDALQMATNRALTAARAHVTGEPVNWNRVCCIDAREWRNQSGDTGLTVIVAYAAPGCAALSEFVAGQLKNDFGDVEVVSTMTKDEFLARAENAWNMGLITPERMDLMNQWLEVVMREGHSRVADQRGGQEQWRYVKGFWDGEMQRLNRRTDETFGASGATFTLANDSDGYALIELAAVLSHPCQACAASRNAWHTRRAFCNHKKAAEPCPST